MGPRNAKKNWFLTYSQNESTPNQLLSALQDIGKLSEYLIAQESHADGGKHLHAYLKFQEEGVTLKDAPAVFNVIGLSGNYQPCRSPKDVIKYCSKDGNYISNFDVEEYMQKKKKLSIATIKSKSARQALEDGDIKISSIRNYNLARSVLVEPYEHTECRGLWIYGKPGSGKSHAVRVSYPDLYSKSQNKWFDGYEGQKTILLDDFDQGGFVLGHHIKIWSDKYACSGEIKGGTAELCHHRFIITSNYLPEEIWGDEAPQKQQQPQMYAAILRRFKVVEKKRKSQTLEYLLNIYDNPLSVPDTPPGSPPNHKQARRASPTTDFQSYCLTGRHDELSIDNA